MNTSTRTEAPPETSTTKTRRTDGLVGNSLVLVGVVLFLCEFVGIIASHVHTMPTVPGSGTSLHTTYAGQAGATGFLVGWYALVLPGRVLIVLGVRQALLSSAPERFGVTWRSLLSWAVGLMALGVVVEVTSAAVLAGTAAVATHGSGDVVLALDHVAHYLQVAIGTPSSMGALVLWFAMWRSGVFPRVLTGLLIASAVVGLVSGALLSAPSTAGLQDSLTILSLLLFVLLVWLGVLVFRHRPRSAPETA